MISQREINEGIGAAKRLLRGRKLRLELARAGRPLNKTRASRFGLTRIDPRIYQSAYASIKALGLKPHHFTRHTSLRTHFANITRALDAAAAAPPSTINRPNA